jgi:hypothetical protein
LAACAAGLTLLGAACSKDERPKQAFFCHCLFLTDTDKQSDQPVEVCAADRPLAEKSAESCAQTGAPATVEHCNCEPRPTEKCPPNDCKLVLPK